MSVARTAGKKPRRAQQPATDKKTADILVDIAQPLLKSLDPAGQQESYRLRLLLASAIWNASRLSDDTRRRDALDQVTTALITQFGYSAHEAEQVAAAVYLRARQYFADERRLMAQVTVQHVRGREYQVRVRSVKVG